MKGMTPRQRSVDTSPLTSHCADKRILVRAALLLLGAALISACVAPGDVGRAPTDVTPPPQTPGPPFATGGPYTLSGIVTFRTKSGVTPLANARVGGFIFKTNGQGYGMAPVVTDADGRYQVSNVPDGVVVLYGEAPHAYQPCAALATVSGANAVKDLELLDSSATRSAMATDSPTLSGVVYRKTAGGKQPVAGAVIEYEYAPVIATATTTDAQGRYSLCRLPLGRGGLDVWLNGVPLGGVVIDIVGDDVLDLTF